MQKSYEAKRHQLEIDYWLFRARRDLIFKLIQKIQGNPHSKILDVGCAGGHLIKSLEKKGFKKVSGIDISNQAINLCKKRGLKSVFIGNATETNFKENTFDIIVADNVLEHIKNEKAAMNEWRRILRRNGRLIVIVPAFNFLWSQHDEICHHFKRYSRLTLIKALEKANLKIDRISFWNFSLFLPVCLVKIFQRIFLKKKRQKGDQLYELNPLANKLLISLLRFENYLLMSLSFPLGVSVFGVAKK